MRTPVRTAAVAACLLCHLVCVAAAQARARAAGGERALLEQGVAALAASDLAAASRLLSQAYRQSPRAAVLYHLARLATAQGRTLDAYDLSRRYLADPSRGADDAAARAAEELLSKPAPDSGSLTVLSDPGALVVVDDRVVATLPLLLPLLLSPGAHTVKLEFPGKALEAPVHIEFGRLTEVRMSRSSGAVLVSVLPAILLGATSAGLPADAGRLLTDAVEQAARDEQYTLLSAELLLAKGEKSPSCLTSEPCQRELAAQRKLDLILQQQVQVQGAAPSASYQLALRLLRVGYAEPAAATTLTCPGCSVEQAAARLKEAAAKLLADGLPRPRGTLRVRTTPAAAMLQLGDRALGPAPRSEPLWAGRYTLTVRYPGYQTDTREVEVLDGKSDELQVELAPLLNATTPTPPPPRSGPGGRAPRPRWRLGVGGAALAVGLGLGIAGGLGLAADGQCVTPPEAAGGACPQLYDTGAVGGASLGVGLGLIGAGVVLVALPGPPR